MAFFSLHGGATRPDALNFNPAFNSALQALYDAAPPEIQRELGLTSGYRSNAVQQRLWNASDKTGHSVARPGHSKHESGDAADLFGFGLKGGGAVSEAAKQWVHTNAGNFGLYFPMGHEPWHIQLRGDGTAAPTDASLGTTLAAATQPSAAAAPPPAYNPFADLAAALNQPAVAPPARESLLRPAASVPVASPASPAPIPTVGTSAPAPQIAAPEPQLADLFKVAAIGAPPPTVPVDRERVVAQARSSRRRA